MYGSPQKKKEKRRKRKEKSHNATPKLAGLPPPHVLGHAGAAQHGGNVLRIEAI